jgi:zinc transporter 5/7
LASIAGLFFFSQYIASPASGKPGVATGLAITALFGLIHRHATLTIPTIFGALCALGYIATHLDGLKTSTYESAHHKDHHDHSHSHTPISHSRLTAYLLSFCAPGSIVDTILRERDSRRIAYFGW